MIKIALCLFVVDLCPHVLFPVLIMALFIGYFNNMQNNKVFIINFPPTRLHSLALIYLLIILSLFRPIIRIILLIVIECIFRKHIPKLNDLLIYLGDQAQIA